MKTALEWFEQLPEPIRTQAMDAFNDSGWSNKDKLYESLPYALTNWEWNNYWFGIFIRATKGEFDQPTPNLHGWIPVSDRLPEEIDAEYLVIDKNQNIKVSYFDGSVWGYWSTVNDDVLFWQPLPKLPEVRNENN